jgi:exopolyphosphatase / guanosine-5'-triphosphate,3'-diphosphate pyrophosphatase
VREGSGGRGWFVTRVAAIDCGTNALRLLVADVDGGVQRDLDRRLEIVRLGQGVARTGRFAPDALARTIAVIETYAARIHALDVQRVRMVATSASRDAANRDAFATGVRAVLGVDPDVISGDEEARLSFAGATRGLPPSLPTPYLVVDIGGGSTELASGTTTVDAACSINVGSVRLSERHFGSDPPHHPEIEAARTEIEAALDDAATAVPISAAGSVVGLAGSVTTVAAIYLGLADYDSAAVHHARVPAAAVREISDRLLAETHQQRAANPVIHPGRVDVIAAGALVLRCVTDRAGVDEVIASEADMLDGIAWELAHEADRVLGAP